MCQYPRRSSSVARQNQGLSNLVIVNQCVSRWVDEGARKLMTIGSIKEIYERIFDVYLNYCVYVIIVSRHIRLLIGTTDHPIRARMFTHGKATNDKEIKCSKRFHLGHSRPLLFPRIKLFDFVTDRLVVRKHNNIYFLYETKT